MGNQLRKYRILSKHGVNAMRAGSLKYIAPHWALFNPGRQRHPLPFQRFAIQQFGNHAEALGIEISNQLRHISPGQIGAQLTGERRGGSVRLWCIHGRFSSDVLC